MNGKFHLEINSFEDFIEFVAILRGKEIDFDKIREFTNKLKEADTKLENAVKAQEET